MKCPECYSKKCMYIEPEILHGKVLCSSCGYEGPLDEFAELCVCCGEPSYTICKECEEPLCEECSRNGGFCSNECSNAASAGMDYFDTWQYADERYHALKDEGNL